LPHVSLAIGKYDIRSIKIDGLNVSLALIEGHNYFDPYFKGIADTLESVITDFLDNYERPINMYFPYPDFSLVEVPLQFKALQHSWTSTLENSQPQMVFLPEKGYGIRQADFKSSLHWMKRRNEQNNEGKTEEELKASLLTDFFQSVLGAENAEMNFFGNNANEATPPNPYSIYPNYYYYVNYISSGEYPVLNYAFESYLKKTSEDPRQMFMSMARGIGDAEKANILLDGKSLKDIIARNDDPIALNRVLKAKGGYLLSFIQKHMADQDFDQFLLKYLYDNSFKEIRFEEFSEEMRVKFGIDLSHFTNTWYTGNKIPAYKVSNVQLIRTIDQNQVVYLVKATVDNQEQVDGLIKFSFRTGGGGGGRGGFGMFGGGMNAQADERIFIMGANETREFQMVMYEQPRGITFNGMIAKNIPVTIGYFIRDVSENNNLKAESYERLIPSPSSETRGVYIVDNEEPGFSVVDPAANNPIKKLFKKQEEERTYVGMNFGPNPTNWSLTANSDFYGEFIRSAMFVKGGTGAKKAIWKTVLPQGGYYDIYVHLNRERGRGFRPGGPGGGGPGGPGGNRGDNDPVGSYYYTIYHDDGVEEVELKLKEVNSGWNMLGSYYLSADTAKIELSDRSEAARVVADAVRWVKEGTRVED